MKKIVLDKIDIISITVYATFIVACIMILGWFLGWFSSCDKLRGNLFDERVLKKYEISWLEKPQNAVNENQYISGETLYVYECEIDDKETFEKYVQNVFNNFKERNYTVAHFVRYVNAMINGSYLEVAESEKLSDYIRDNDSFVNYSFYYSTETVEEMEWGDMGGTKKFGNRYLEIKLPNNINENGKLQMRIILYGGKGTRSNIIYVE